MSAKVFLALMVERVRICLERLSVFVLQDSQGNTVSKVRICDLVSSIASYKIDKEA